DQIKLLNERNAFFSLSAQKQTQLKWMFAIICLLLAAVVGILFNRYRLKQKSMKVIEQKSRENATLVQEMHHRVKNNLQIMLSLLGTQSNLINDSEARKLILESQNRIKSMALIHKNLYQSGSLVMVKADHYFDEIARNILSSFDNNEHNVALKTDIANQEISMAVAVPLGLILNELLTNSIKYAFNGTKDAELVVSFTKAEKDSSYCLRVEDNGKGLPEDFNIATSNSFGLKLVEGLIHQLNGSLEIVRNVGTCFDIYFKDLSRV
ncbi:MAG: sensor histidine kinase, partial [Bacteroidota bacterium]